jgi:HTH-type transcriptional regulator / antitoxin HigA
MDIRPIKTEADYDWALQEIALYFEHEPAPSTEEAARFDVLSALIEHYENRRWSIDLPDPVDVIRFRMEQGGFTQADLAMLLGSKSRASEVLSHRRRLTMEQVSLLHRSWGIPAEALLSPVPAAA